MANAALLERLRAKRGQFSSVRNDIVKLGTGRTTLRLLVPDDADQMHQLRAVHYIKSAEGAKPMVFGSRYHVPPMDQPQDRPYPCPIHEAIEQAIKSAKDDVSLKLYKDWRASKEVLVWAIITSGQNADPSTPRIVSLTPTTFDAVEQLILGEYPEILDRGEDGCDIAIDKEGAGLNTKYRVSTMKPAKCRPVPEGVIERCSPLRLFVEREDFRKHESGAIAAIADYTGIGAALGITMSRGTELLTSDRGRVAGADVSVPDETPRQTAAEKVAAAVATKGLVAEVLPSAATPKPEPEVVSAKPKAPAKPKAAPEAAPASAAAEPGTITDDEMASIMAELDGI